MKLFPQHGHRAEPALYGFRQQFGDLGGRPQPTGGIRTTAHEWGERHTTSDDRIGQSTSSFDVHVIDGANLAAAGNEDVNLRPTIRLLEPAHGPTTQPVAATGLDTGHHRVWTRQQQCGVDQLVDGRGSGEQHHDPGKHALPGPALEAATVDRSLGVAESHQLAHSGHPEREVCAQPHRALKTHGVHALMVAISSASRGLSADSFAGVNRCARRLPGKPLSWHLAT
jgi:hypothetical protein